MNFKETGTIILSCEVCNLEPALGVVCVPGVPYSAAYGRLCLEAGAHPWGVLVATTGCLGGWEEASEWWKQMCKDTWEHLGKTQEDFLKAVGVEEDFWRKL